MLPQGLLSFPLTPFNAAGEVDLDVLSAHLEDQVAQNPDGIFVAAGAGEFTALSLDEYEQVVTRSVEVVAGKIPLFSGVGAGPQHAVATSQISEKAGIDGVLLLPPYLVSSTQEGLLNHVRNVAASTSLPLVPYQRANAVFTHKSAVELLDIPTVVGLKDGYGDIELINRIVVAIRNSGHARAADFGFQNGQPTAELSATAYSAIGVGAYSSAVHNFAPDIARAFYDALTSGDAERVNMLLSAFYLPFSEIRDAVPGYAVALIKAGTTLRGFNMGSVRAPLVDAKPEHVEQLRDLIDSTRAKLAAA